MAAGEWQQECRRNPEESSVLKGEFHANESRTLYLSDHGCLMSVESSRGRNSNSKRLHLVEKNLRLPAMFKIGAAERNTAGKVHIERIVFSNEEVSASIKRLLGWLLANAVVPASAVATFDLER